MNKADLLTQSSTLASEQQTARQKVAKQQLELSRRRDAIQQKLLVLQAELDAISEEQRTLVVVGHEQEQTFVAQDIQLITTALMASQKLVNSLLIDGDARAILDLRFENELIFGNIHLLLAAMTVLGPRYPALWSFGLLTKVTPGIGILWFIARGEWRQVLIVVLTTLALVLGSVIIGGGRLWFPAPSGPSRPPSATGAQL